MTLLSIAFSLFLLMDPIGNIPLYISTLKKIHPKRQRTIILRELLIALAIIILFAFVGNGLMDFLEIESATIQIAGGLILFLLCLKMIFPLPHDPHDASPQTETEPFVVPLAVPLVAGPGVLAAVMIFAQQETHPLIMIGAILTAWVSSLLILLCSSFLKRILGTKGIIALERLMGLILILISVQMFLSGLGSFLQHCNAPPS